MATTRQYRGYDSLPMRRWSQWCVGIYPTRADLPITGALDAEQPRLKKGRCGSRSQTEDRPHSRTPELSVRQLICVTSALVRFCMSANDPKRTSRAGTFTPHIIRGRCRTRRCASSSALGSAPCRNQSNWLAAKSAREAYCKYRRTPGRCSSGASSPLYEALAWASRDPSRKTLLPRSFMRGRDADVTPVPLLISGSAIKAEKCSSSRYCSGSDYLPAFSRLSTSASLTSPAATSALMHCSERLLPCSFMQSQSSSPVHPAHNIADNDLRAVAILPFCIGDGTREGCRGKRPGREGNYQKMISTCVSSPR